MAEYKEVDGFLSALAKGAGQMSVSTYVVGIKSPDEEWEKMKAVWDACEAANVDIPSEVEEYFAGMRPDKKGVFVDLKFSRYEDKGNHPAVSLTVNTGQEFWDVELAKLPHGVKIVRFVNSW